MDTKVDALHAEFAELIAVLDKTGEISLRSTADDVFRKALLLAAASLFERNLCETLLSFARALSPSSVLLGEFVNNKAISRQYHSFFDWDANNGNRFFSLFGQQFKDFVKSEVTARDDLERGIKAFLEIGRERNRLVHQDFGSFVMEKNASEIYGLYKDATVFLKELPRLFDDFDTLRVNESLEERTPEGGGVQ